MKKLILAVCFVIGATAMSFAQGGGGGGQGGGRGGMAPDAQAKMYQTQLKLTDDQTAKITAILTAQAAVQTAKRDSMTKAGVDPQAMRGALAPLRTATNAKIRVLLTADQATEFDKMAAQMGGRGGRGGGGGGQGGGGGTPPPPPPAK